MRRRIVLNTVLALFLLGTLFGVGQAAEQPKYGGVLRVAVTASPPTLDFQASNTSATRVVATHIFESLVTFDKSYKPVPMLAEKWDLSNDGKIYTFYLRKGVLFHNGDEMKAEDVKASVERFAKIAPRRRDLSSLELINIIDDYTIEFKLKKPIGPFIAILGIPNALLAIMPKEAVEGRAAKKADIIGTGPYQLVEWIPDRHIKLKRFKDYKPLDIPASGYAGKKAGYLNEIYFIPVTEPGARVAGLETGDYDFADFLPGNSVPDLKQNPKLVIKPLMPCTAPLAYINHTRHFKNKKLRQAVQAGLDHEAIMIAGSEGAGRLNPGMYFEEQVWHSKIEVI
jgi:peptide/nickel transport system substrate-binding protein